MSCIAIITARGGSKRIPRKNIKDFLGKPIIAYSIEAALASNLFDEVMVSTDDAEIAQIAQKYGAKVPFQRSEKASDDFATTADVINEVLKAYQQMGQYFSTACCIYPTAPFVTKELLQKASQTLKDGEFDAVFPVMRFSYPIQRCLVQKTDQRFVLREPQYFSARSQDLEPCYHDAGQFYFFDVARFFINQRLMTDNTSCIEISELEAQDIDNEQDWKLAELKYQLLYEKL